MEKVTKYTRAGKDGIVLVCPHCEREGITYHFAWLSKMCQGCKKITTKAEWLIGKRTRVIFRKWKDGGEIIAFFPEMVEPDYMIESYMHTGQHSPADYISLISDTALAGPEEYQSLKEELESIGYILDVKQKAKINWR